MKSGFFAFAWTFLLVAPMEAAQPAHVEMHCLSLRFQSAAGGAGEAVTLQLTSDSSLTEINGELWPSFDDQLPTHLSYFVLDDPTFPDRLDGRIAFDVPGFSDVNQDGFSDFFETSQAVVATVTQGFFETPIDSGSVTATWSREAGSAVGRCRLRLVGEAFGPWPDFDHPFELLEYRGRFSYQRDTNAAAGTVSLDQVQTGAGTLTGLISLGRIGTNRFNQLDLAPGSLTNETGQALAYVGAELDRDEGIKTNYLGLVDFEDGDLATGTQDFGTWMLIIGDGNDADLDGIPNLSDDIGASPGAQPTLSLRRVGQELRLSINAEAGASYDLEETMALSPAAWLKSASVTLTNSAQILTLPVPNTTTKYWQLRLP
ncbi:MAG: hypothetical protein U1G07_03185 [Verrucomicrobiota bacterium]